MPTGDNFFETMSVTVNGRVARIVFDNPPMNLLDARMFNDLDRLGRWLERQDSIGVVVFESADPDFFIAHADLSMLESMPRLDPEAISGPSLHQAIVDRFRTLPQLTIGKIRGIARGGGSEFLLALDLRYGAEGRAVLGQPEITLGFPPGCGATQRLPKLMGRANAFEAIVGGLDYTATEAARMGWINRAVPDEGLDDFVEKMVTLVASRPPLTIAQAKHAINSATGPLEKGLQEEFAAFLRSFQTEQAISRLNQAMAAGFQTRELERGCLNEWSLALIDK